MDFSTNWAVWMTVVVSFIFLYKYLTRNFGYWESQGVPSEKAYPIIGSEWENFLKPFHLTDEKRIKKHGRIFGTYFLTIKIFNVIDAEIIKLILVKDFNFFVNRQVKRSNIKMFDEGMILALDDDWKRIRSICSPTFSSGKIRKMAHLVKDVAEKLTSSLLQIAEKEEAVNIKTEFSKYSIQVIGACAFGIHFDSFENPDHPFVLHAKKAFAGGLKSFLQFLFLNIFSGFLPEFIKENFNRSIGISFFSDIAKDIIKLRRNQKNHTNVDFLQLLIDAKDEKTEDENLEKDSQDSKTSDEKKSRNGQRNKTLDESEIIAQCATFLFAGHDTVASALSYVAYNLARHPDVQDILLREIDEAWDTHETIDYDIINKMTYLNAVISETLRLQSVAVRIIRQAKEDYTIPGTNIIIPKDTIISIPVYCLHHDPEYFPEPEKFDPDRFLPENKDNILPYTYMPFADGPRNCIAMRFALMEMKFCLAFTLRYVKFSPTEETLKPLQFVQSSGPLLLCKETIVRPEKRIRANM